MMHFDSADYNAIPTNAILSGISTSLAFVVNSDILPTIVLPIAFFVVGKTIDVLVRVWLNKRKK